MRSLIEEFSATFAYITRKGGKLSDMAKAADDIVARRLQETDLAHYAEQLHRRNRAAGKINPMQLAMGGVVDYLQRDDAFQDVPQDPSVASIFVDGVRWYKYTEDFYDSHGSAFQIVFWALSPEDAARRKESLQTTFLKQDFIAAERVVGVTTVVSGEPSPAEKEVRSLLQQQLRRQQVQRMKWEV